MTSSNYKNYSQRTIIEDEGNTHLYWDKDGYLSYLYRGKQKKLISPYKDFPSISAEHIRRSWWGIRSWDFHAAEIKKNRLRVFIRARKDTSFDVDIMAGTFIEVWEFDKKSGAYIGKEIPTRDNSNAKVFYYDIKSDRSAIEKYNVSWFSDLEMWLLSNSELTSKYESDKGSHSSPKKLGRLEDYAFQQWNIFNPNATPPLSPGLEQGIRKAPEDKSNYRLSNNFTRKSTDKITNFNPATDTLEIDTDSFGIDSSATFAAGKNNRAVKKKLAKQDFDFLYDQKKGGLYFNENGSDKGFGDGGIIAILKGAPELEASDFTIV